MAAELKRGDASIGLADQIEGLEPSGERQLCALQDRAVRERALMAADAALIAFEPAAIRPFSWPPQRGRRGPSGQRA